LRKRILFFYPQARGEERNGLRAICLSLGWVKLGFYNP